MHGHAVAVALMDQHGNIDEEARPDKQSISVAS